MEDDYRDVEFYRELVSTLRLLTTTWEVPRAVGTTHGEYYQRFPPATEWEGEFTHEYDTRNAPQGTPENLSNPGYIAPNLSFFFGEFNAKNIQDK